MGGGLVWSHGGGCAGEGLRSEPHPQAPDPQVLTHRGLPCVSRLATCTGMYGNLAIMITLGIILLVVGFILKIAILWAIGIILVVVGAILALLGAAGRAVFGRRHYW